MQNLEFIDLVISIMKDYVKDGILVLLTVPKLTDIQTYRQTTNENIIPAVHFPMIGSSQQQLLNSGRLSQLQ